ncbi:SDR family NAD(P)-dependent oxidoreductase [Sulfurimonas sp.]|uniref:SDR family NAD(P)-dependent oxidoreductase n=1 Tax=Sulfurimonas sp. TaxID=2022749 RepID=UPI003D1158A9
MIVIIGGTSGIGLQTAQYLKAQNKDVLVGGRHTIKDDIDYKFLDVTDEASIKAFFEAIASSPIEALIYSVGITIGQKSIKEFDKNIFENIIDVNVTGALLCLKYAYDSLAKNKAKVVIVNSLASRTFSAFSGVEYTMSKSALSGMVKQLSVEFAEDNIMINSIFPSMTATPMLVENVSKEKLAQIEKTIPMKRVAKPLEVAKAIEFLISKDNTYMTGCGIDLNGGQFLNG